MCLRSSSDDVEIEGGHVFESEGGDAVCLENVFESEGGDAMCLENECWGKNRMSVVLFNYFT